MKTTTTGRTRASTARPKGREAVSGAIMEAAARLFAARGFAGVSVRDVASEAGVNHGLLHRHFGSKDELAAAVLRGQAEQLARDAGRDRDFVSLALAQQDVFVRSPYFRLLAHALLEGRDVHEMQGGFPVVSHLVEVTARARDAGQLPVDEDPRVLVAMGVAFWLGWMLFEPFLLLSTGLGLRARTRVRGRVRALWQHGLAAATAGAR